MTTDREAACWLMAALLVVVLTFSVTGCAAHPQTARIDEPVFAAAAPVMRWTVQDEADALPARVAAAGRVSVADQGQGQSQERAAAPGFADPTRDEIGTTVPRFTLEQVAQVDALVAHGIGEVSHEPGRSVPNVESDIEPAEPSAGPATDDSDAALGLLTGGGPEGPMAAGGALTDAASRMVRTVGGAFGPVSAGRLALGLGGVTLLAFALQALALAVSLQTPPPALPRLTLGPAPTPFPRPPVGGAARPLPFPGVVAFGAPRLARAA